MNEFDNDNLYQLTDQESQRNVQGLVYGLLYLVLAAVVAITGAHAVMLVLSQTATYTFAAEDSLITTILTALRVAFPLLVEASAVVVGIGFIKARWQGPQKIVGLGIELIWLLFAALNMITFFAVERGQPLQSWQTTWIQYGLPLSALIAGALTYSLMRVDPAHRRQQEQAATAERVNAMRFQYFQKARLSPAMLNIERQRAYLQVIDDLRRQGYTDAQIRFMASHTPELTFDGDESDLPDVREVGPATVTRLAHPINDPSPPSAGPSETDQPGANGPIRRPHGGQNPNFP